METANLALLIPILGIVFGMTVAIVAIVSQARRRTHEVDLRHKERLAAIERGLDVPPDPVEPNGRPVSHQQYLLRGMVWLGVGVAVYFAAGDLIGDRLAQLGAVPAAVGIANLVFYFVARPKDADQPGGGPPATS